MHAHHQHDDADPHHPEPAAQRRKYRGILTPNAKEIQRLARMTFEMLYLAKTEKGLNLRISEDVF